MPGMKNASKSLTEYDTYPCPLCYRGEISSMPLMESFGCNFCHHIFLINFEAQTLKIADGQVPITWKWNGKKWQTTPRQDNYMSFIYILSALAFIILPTSIVGWFAYYFPLLPHTPLAWLPLVWTGLTLISHSLCLIWLLLSYYQFPIGLYFRSFANNLLSR